MFGVLALTVFYGLWEKGQILLLSVQYFASTGQGYGSILLNGEL